MNTLKTTEEICVILKVRRETLFKWRKCGMPFKRIMGVIRYDLDEVEAWVSSQNEGIIKAGKDFGGGCNE